MNKWSMCFCIHCLGPWTNVPSCPFPSDLFRSDWTEFDLTCLPLLASCPGNGIRYHDREYARTVFFTENENKESEVNLCSTVLPFILFYVLHFGCCSPLIPHTSQRHLFQVSASKGTGENKCVLRRPERGHLRANQSRFLLGGPGGARSLVTALWCCWDAKPDVT